MNQTKHYWRLEKRHIELRRALLPKIYSPTGKYKSSTYERVSGYMLLIHAEIEFYFEEVVKEIIQHAYKQWDVNRIASKTLVSLMAYSTEDFPAVPEHTADQKAKKDLVYRTKEAYDSFNTYVRARNNGIKEKNILALLLPIGVTIPEIDNNLLIALNNFGRKRGELAHSTRAQNPIAPPDAEYEICEILTHIKNLDQMLCSDYLK